MYIYIPVYIINYNMYTHVWSFGTCPTGYLVIFGVPVLKMDQFCPRWTTFHRGLGRFFYWVGGSRNIIEYLYNYIHLYYTNIYCTKHFSHWVALVCHSIHCTPSSVKKSIPLSCHAIPMAVGFNELDPVSMALPRPGRLNWVLLHHVQQGIWVLICLLALE